MPRGLTSQKFHRNHTGKNEGEGDSAILQDTCPVCSYGTAATRTTHRWRQNGCAVSVSATLPAERRSPSCCVCRGLANAVAHERLDRLLRAARSAARSTLGSAITRCHHCRVARSGNSGRQHVKQRFTMRAFSTRAARANRAGTPVTRLRSRTDE